MRASRPELDPRLAAVLKERGIEALYLHQAEAVRRGTGRAAHHGRHPGGQRQDPVLQPARAQPPAGQPGCIARSTCFRRRPLRRTSWPNSHVGIEFLNRGAPPESAPLRGRAWQNALPETRAPAGRVSATGPGDRRCPIDWRPRMTATRRPASAPGSESSQIILSNPDMLHAGILPQHTRWAEFFAHLAPSWWTRCTFTAGCSARMSRTCCAACAASAASTAANRSSSSRPRPSPTRATWPTASASAGHGHRPGADGAPHGEQHVLFYNPPLVDPALGIRRSSNQEAAELAGHFLADGVQVIVFARTRLATELIVNTHCERNEEIAATCPSHHTLLAHSRLPRGLPAAGAPGHRARAAQGNRARGRRDQRAGTRYRYRTVGRGTAGRLSRHHRQHPAADGPRGRRQGVSVGLLVARPTPSTST